MQREYIIGREAADERPAGYLGHYRAPDGSRTEPLYLDFDGPHAALVVGKRGYGKSYTMGVIAEELARTDGVAPVVVDPMGAFETMGEGSDGEPVPTAVDDDPVVAPSSLDPRSWCSMLELSPESGTGGLVWRAAAECSTIPGMREHVGDTDAPDRDKRAALNHLDLAETWEVFDEQGLSATDLATPEVTVLNVSELDAAPMNAVVRGVAETLYAARVERQVHRLPWLMVDEVHTFFDGVAGGALETLLTRGRAPGVSAVLATQRPSAIPEVGISQADLLVAHRLTSREDLDALTDAQPTYMDGSLGEQMPGTPGETIIIDDATESVHSVLVRERDTPHGGGSPSVSALDDGTPTVEY